MRLHRLLPPVLAAVLIGLAAAPGADGRGRTQVACASATGEAVAYRVKPRFCTFHTRGTDFIGATQITVVDLRWHGWASKHPTARGTVRANMGFRARVTVRLSGRRTCHGHRRYESVRLRFPGGEAPGGTTRLDTCTD